jgi:dolichol-phosphate mannosyltransferase
VLNKESPVKQFDEPSPESPRVRVAASHHRAARAPAMISVVLPVYNEHENLGALIDRLRPVLIDATGGDFEVLFVDDGSADGSAEILDAFHVGDPRLKIVHFSRNFGHQAALQAGLDESNGRAVVLMDADLQDPPELLHQFIDLWRQGNDVVYAVRTKRKEHLLKRVAYKAFYRTFKAVADLDVPLDAGDFCLLDRRVVTTLVSLPERNRFLRGLRSWVGFRQARVEYERDARHAGEPKYTFRKLVQLAFSGYIGFSSMPLRLAAWLGFGVATAGFALGAWAMATKLMDIPSPRGWASTVAVMLFVGGMNLLMLGVIGEYLGRVYDEVRQRPLYVVRSSLGLLRQPGRRDDEAFGQQPVGSEVGSSVRA